MRKKLKKRQKIIFVLICLVSISASGYGIWYLHRIQSYKKIVREIKIKDVDLGTIKDGQYIGEKDAKVIKAKVRVTVKDHKIEKIDFLNYQHERGEKAKLIPIRIIEKQRIGVDAVSGATNASKVIQKAVENALLESTDENN